MTEQELLLRDYPDCQNAIWLAEIVFCFSKDGWSLCREEKKSLEEIIGIFKKAVNTFVNNDLIPKPDIYKVRNAMSEWDANSFRRYVAARLGMM